MALAMDCRAITGIWTYLPIIFGYALLTIAVWRIVKRREPRTTFWWGTFLVLFGIFGPLYAALVSALAPAPVHDFERDSFLIVAAIGGNLVASAVLKFELTDRVLPDWMHRLIRRKTTDVASGTAAESPSIPVAAMDSAIDPAPRLPVTSEQADDAVSHPGEEDRGDERKH